MKITVLLLCVSAASFCTVARAEALRCNGDLAQVGDSKSSVLQKCGEPFFIDSYCKPLTQFITPDGATVIAVPCQVVDEWSYNPGPGQFIATLRFEAGVMRSIKFGERVQ